MDQVWIQNIIKIYKNMENKKPKIKDILTLNKTTLVKDHHGFYFNGQLVISSQAQPCGLYNLLYDPANQLTVWLSPQGRLGLDVDVYTGDANDATKIFVPPDILQKTELIKHGTQLYVPIISVIPVIDQFPFNG